MFRQGLNIPNLEDVSPMADVNVSVMVDGKPVFVHGAAGAPDGCAAVSAGLDAAVAHFRAVAASRAPAPAPQQLSGGQPQAPPKPQDTPPRRTKPTPPTTP